VLSDIAACNLRSITWVIPTGANSDHAKGNDGGGPSWVASIVNAIGNSTACDNHTGYWENTAIVIAWDDWGGWYDHERPSFLGQPEGDYQYGFRVPMIFVSAYTPAGYINNVRHDFGSILRFVEHNFGIREGALNFADSRATSDLAGFAEVRGKEIVFLREMTGQQTVLTDLEGYGATAADYDIRVENRKTGAGVRQTSDRRMTKLVFWSNPRTVCPEAYVDMRIEPGQEFKWRISYEFYTVSPAMKK